MDSDALATRNENGGDLEGGERFDYTTPPPKPHLQTPESRGTATAE